MKYSVQGTISEQGFSSAPAVWFIFRSDALEISVPLHKVSGAYWVGRLTEENTLLIFSRLPDSYHPELLSPAKTEIKKLNDAPFYF